MRPLASRAAALLAAAAGLAWPAPGARAQRRILVPTNQPTIQTGIDAAVDTDIVFVLPGTYRENIDFKGKAIQVIGASRESCTIDGGLSKPCVTFQGGETRQAVLQTFTLVRGLGLPNYSAPGGGIRIMASSPTIRQCRIEQCISGHRGGGIGVTDLDPVRQTGIRPASPLVEDCEIVANVAGTPAGSATATGGGLAFDGLQFGSLGGKAEVRRCVVRDNEANLAGGGLYAAFRHDVLVEDCVFTGNRTLGTRGEQDGGAAIGLARGVKALLRGNRIFGNNSKSNGGGVKFYNCTGSLLVSTTIAANTGGGLAGYADRDLFGVNVSLDVVNSILWGNGPPEIALTGSDQTQKPPAVTVTASCVQGGYAGTGNLATDPLLLNAGSGNHRLAAVSPCRNAGDNAANGLPAADFEGDARVLEGRTDIGADEHRADAAFLWADRSTLSLASPGVTRFEMRGGAPRAGLIFVLLPGLSGTRPGLDIGGLHLPLNLDAVTFALVGAAPHFVGVLDAQGAGSTAMNLTGLPLPPGLLGQSFSFAAAFLGLTTGPRAFSNDDSLRFER